MITTLQQFVPDLLERIVVCDDPSIYTDSQRFDLLCKFYQSRIHRIIGGDIPTEKIKEKNGARIVVVQRQEGSASSTEIKKLLNNGGIDRLRSLVADSVFKEIMESGYYHGTT